jgi:hypothetical protein
MTRLNRLAVQLSSVGNPELGQSGLISSPKTMIVSTTEEARDECIKCIREWSLGSGNWSDGEVTDGNSNFVAYMSCNGRVWKKASTVSAVPVAPIENSTRFASL